MHGAGRRVEGMGWLLARRYWLRVLHRARREALRSVGWNKQTAWFFSTAFVVGSIVHLLLFGLGEMLDEWAVTLSFVVAPIALFILFLFLWNMFVSPAIMANEADTRYTTIEHERNNLKNQLQQKKYNQQTISNLQEAYENGTVLLCAGPKPSPGEWRQNIIKWFHDTESLIPQSEAWMFRTNSDVPKSDTTFDHCGNLLSVRLENLRSVISRLSPE